MLSVITYGELIYGAVKSAKRAAALERLHELTNPLPALPLPERAAEAYGTIRAQLEAKGEMIGNNNLWIAAHALTSELTLVTNNEKEFRRVHGLTQCSKVRTAVQNPKSGSLRRSPVSVREPGA